MDLTLLGSGAPLAPGRSTLGLLLRAPDAGPLLLDACGGFEVADALRRADAFEAVGRATPEVPLELVLSHRHGDHIGGVPALAIAAPALRVWGPPDALAGARALLAAAYPELIGVLEHRLELRTLSPGARTDIAGFVVTPYEVVHRVPTVALRVEASGRVLAYSADSLPCEALVACAAGADLFVCDALCEDAHAARARALMHPTAREAGELARRAGAKRLALVHLARFADPAAVRREAEAAFGGPVELPDDGARFSL